MVYTKHKLLSKSYFKTLKSLTNFDIRSDTMIDKMTTTVQEALGQAQQVAITRHHQAIDIPHLWLIFTQDDHFAGKIYQDLGIRLADFRQ